MRGRLDSAGLRHAEQRTGPAAPAVAHAFGPPARQQRMPLDCEGIQVATLLRPRAQYRRSRRGACTRMTGVGDGAARGRSTPQTRRRSGRCIAPGMCRGHGWRVSLGRVYTSLLCQVS